MEMNSIGETYAHRIELQGIDIDGSTIQTNNTNGDIILLPNGTGRTQIEAIQFLDRTIYTTGTNIGTLGLQVLDILNLIKIVLYVFQAQVLKESQS